MRGNGCEAGHEAGCWRCKLDVGCDGKRSGSRSDSFGVVMMVAWCYSWLTRHDTLFFGL